jgi:1-acyl-sn-glycerol-3-phosphate acyltransferase
VLPDPSDCDIFEFKPPRMQSAFVRIAQKIFPFLLKLRFGNFTYEIERGLESVMTLGTNRMMLCPNHSSTMDMDVAFLFTCILHEPLYFLCAREVFQGSWINRYVLQLFGCYSIVRGTLDHSSYAQSIEILKTGKHKLVLYPEGEISGSNNLILPLKPGAAHLAVKAFLTLKREEKEAPVFLVPVALRYTYPNLSAKFLLESITSVESALDIKGDQNQSMQTRIEAVSEAILRDLLYKYDCRDVSGSLSERVATLRKIILDRLAAYVGIDNLHGLDEIDAAHRLYVKLYQQRWYEEQLEKCLNFETHHIRYQLLNELIRDYHRAMRFIAIGNSFEGMQQQNQDDLINLLMLIKRDICPAKKWRMPVHLLISFGDPINVQESLARHPHHGEAEQLLTTKLQEEMQSGLIALINSHH